MGVRWIVREPQVLYALDPSRALELIAQHQISALAVLAGVFLTVTGGEALYADMGHFGKSPIRLGWMCIVMPALVLNYFGQGALLIENPASISNPFYLMAPEWSLWPLVVIATAATVIASQAVISGVFSVTTQAVSLGLFPAAAGRTFLGGLRRTDLRANDELDHDGCRVGIGGGFRQCGGAGRRLWPGRLRRHDHRDAVDLESHQIANGTRKPRVARRSVAAVHHRPRIPAVEL